MVACNFWKWIRANHIRNIEFKFLKIVLSIFFLKKIKELANRKAGVNQCISDPET